MSRIRVLISCGVSAKCSARSSCGGPCSHQPAGSFTYFRVIWRTSYNLRGRLRKDSVQVLLRSAHGIAREIHDTLAQGLTGIVVQLNAAEEILNGDVDKASQHMDRARQLARTSLEEARSSVLALRPEFERGNLAAALQRVADQLIAGTMIKVDISSDELHHHLSAEVETNLFRICQEARIARIAETPPTTAMKTFFVRSLPEPKVICSRTRVRKSC